MKSRSENFKQIIHELFETAQRLGLSEINSPLYTACKNLIESDLPQAHFNDPMSNQVVLQLDNSSARYLQELLRSDREDRIADAIFERIDEQLCIEISFEQWLKEFQPKPVSIFDTETQKQRGLIWDIECMSNINNLSKTQPKQMALAAKAYPYGLGIYVQTPTEEQWQAWQESHQQTAETGGQQ
jgi:hypothetical protein